MVSMSTTWIRRNPDSAWRTTSGNQKGQFVFAKLGLIHVKHHED